MAKTAKVFIAGFSIFVLCLAGCKNSGNLPVGEARISIALTVAEIDRVTATVTAADIYPHIEAELSVQNGEAAGLIVNIPAGTGRLFTINAYRSGEIVCTGTALAEILADQRVQVYINLQCTPDPEDLGEAEINGGFNFPPRIDSAYADKAQVERGENVNLSLIASDPNGNPLTYAWIASDGVFTPPDAAATVWTAPGTDGVYTLTATVSDDKGGQASLGVDIEVVRVTCDFGETYNGTLAMCQIASPAVIGPASSFSNDNEGSVLATPDAVYSVVGWRSFVFMGEVYRAPRNADGTLLEKIFEGEPTDHLTCPLIAGDYFYLFGDDNGSCCNRDRSDMAPVMAGGDLGAFSQIVDLPYTATGMGSRTPRWAYSRANRLYIDNGPKEPCCGMAQTPNVAALSTPINADGTLGAWRFEWGADVPNVDDMGYGFFMARGDYAYVFSYDKVLRQFTAYRAPFEVDGSISSAHENVNVDELNYLAAQHQAPGHYIFSPWGNDILAYPNEYFSGACYDDADWTRLYWLKIRPGGVSTHLAAVSEPIDSSYGCPPQFSSEGGQAYFGAGAPWRLKVDLP